MNDRLENGALAALLVLTLILVGFSLRSRSPEAAAPAGPGTSASPPASPTASPTSSSSATASAGSVVFLGDSVAEGKSATAPAKRWTRIVAAELGLTEVNLGHARTGYIRMGPEGSCGATACPNFEGIAAEVARAKPKAIVVTGGGNDAGRPAEEFAQAVADTLTDLKKAAPGATVYVVNPWWDLRPVPSSLSEQTSAVQAAAKNADVIYLDTQQPLVDKPDLMVAGGTNPNDAGHAVLAKAVADAIARSG
jgi:lysophospholipase L1-like esterase